MVIFTGMERCVPRHTSVVCRAQSGDESEESESGYPRFARVTHHWVVSLVPESAVRMVMNVMPSAPAWKPYS